MNSQTWFFVFRLILFLSDKSHIGLRLQSTTKCLETLHIFWLESTPFLLYSKKFPHHQQNALHPPPPEQCCLQQTLQTQATTDIDGWVGGGWEGLLKWLIKLAIDWSTNVNVKVSIINFVAECRTSGRLKPNNLAKQWTDLRFSST